MSAALALRGARILIVDDSESIRAYLASLLTLQGHRADTAEDGRRALGLIEAGASPDLVLLDVMMPGIDGLETLRRIREREPRLPVVMVSVVGSARAIVEAMRAGASDYVNKPLVEAELLAVIARTLERAAHEAERVRGEERGSAALWNGPALAQVRAVIAQVAETDVTVLIQGESGTGKEVVARALHAASQRRKGPFVKVNCAALPGELLESELFGYERGAFTGAFARKPGKFEVARRRHAVPRRDRRDELDRAGQAAARAPGRDLLAARRQPRDPRRRARGRRHPPPARRAGGEGAASARTSTSG